MLNLQQKAFICNLKQKLRKYYPVSKIVFQTIILKMSQQKQFFKNIDQLGYVAQQLDLKVRSSKQSRDAALKLVNCNNQQLKNIFDALIKEYELLIKLSFNEELTKVFNCFNLKDYYVKEAEKIDQDDQNEENQENLFLLLEMGAFMHTLKNMFDEMIKSKNYTNQQVNEMLAFQMLNGLNYLHSDSILHKNLTRKIFLISQKGTIRLYDLGFDFSVNQSQSYDKPIKHTQSYLGSEVENKFFKIETDLYTLGSVILEFDNLSIMEGYWIQQEETTKKYRGEGILTKFKDQINRKSNLFQSVEIFLHPNYQIRKSAVNLIQLLMGKKDTKSNLIVYQAISQDLVKEQAKIISQCNQKKQANKSLRLEKNELIELFEKLSNKKEYNKSFIIISSDNYGIVLATKNVKRAQVEDKTKIENEVKITKKIQIPLILELYDHYFIKVLNQKTYIIYEFKRSSQGLFILKIDAEINNDDKLQILHQIVESLRFLPSFNLIHKYLSPDYLLVLIKDNLITVKYSDSGLSIQLFEKEKGIITQQMISSINIRQKNNIIRSDIRSEKLVFKENKSNNLFSFSRIKLTQDTITDTEWILSIAKYVSTQFPVYSECGIQRCLVPEQIRTYYSLLETDIFSLSTRLYLLHKYDQLMLVYDNKCKQISIKFEKPFFPLNNEQKLINRKSAMYLNTIKNTLVYERCTSRKDLSKILQDLKSTLSQKQIIYLINQRIITINQSK
ncbi:hypothetical protein ABPG72_020841 [Tetrahymena utriculariae]